MEDSYKPIPAKRKWLKEILCQLILLVLARALQSASRFDPGLEEEIASWPEGFRIRMTVLPQRSGKPRAPSMVLAKSKGCLRHLGSRPIAADLTIGFKNIESAFLVLTPQLGAAKAFAENRLSVAGDLARAVAFTRCLDRILNYLYPAIITKRLVKRLPAKPYGLYRRRLYLYLVGIPFGR